MKNPLIIGSRGSRLALWQAEWVRSKLAALSAQTEIQIEIIKTSGDVLKDAPLSVIGGKGVFTKEIEEALRDRRIDLAVHSLKDLPTILPAGLAIAAITEREDARDALVLREDVGRAFSSLDTLPAGVVVGTSSPRRLAQMRHSHPHLKIKELRGNVDTRLRKLDAGEYDAIILAVAGLSRLGFEHRISERIRPTKMLPAVGQGALAIEIRAEDAGIHDLLAPLDHGPTRAACTAERALLRALGGGCQLPIAAHAVVYENHVRLDGLVAAPDGENLIREMIEGEASEAAQLGEALADRLLKRGANALLAGSST